MQIKIKNVFNAVDKVLLVLNVFLAILLLFCYLSPTIAPDKAGAIALVGLAYPLLCGFNSLFLLYWLLRSKLYWLISFCCIVVGFKFLVYYFGFSMPVQVEKTKNAIKVLSYNVHNFMGIDTNRVTYTETPVIDLITANHPDVVSIQEFSVNVKNNKPIYAALKRGLLSDQYCFTPYDCARWDTVGLAVFSKYPIINHGIITTKPFETENEIMFVDIRRNEKIFRVYNVHLEPIHFTKTEHHYLRGLEHRGKINLTLMSVIFKKLELAFVRRSYTISLLKKNMAGCPYPYIIAGDFNDTPISYVVTRISEGLKNAFIEKGRGLGTTYYGDFPHFQIDYILASKQFDVLGYQTIKKKISDHYPIMSELALK